MCDNTSNIASYGDNSLIGVDISYYGYDSNSSNNDDVTSDYESGYDGSYDDFDFDAWYQDIMSEAETINEYDITDIENYDTIDTSDTAVVCATKDETAKSVISDIFFPIMGIFGLMSTVGVIVIAIAASSKHE